MVRLSHRLHFIYDSEFDLITIQISGLSFVQMRQKTIPALGQMGVSVEGNSGRPGLFNEGSDLAQPSRSSDLIPGVTLPQMDPYEPSKRWFEIFARGPGDIDWSLTTEESFVSVSPSSGTLKKGEWDEKVFIEVDWDQVPDDYNHTTIIYVNTTQADGGYEELRLPLLKTQVPESFKGFVESDKVVAMEAAHFQSSSPTSNDSISYQTVPHVGRTIEDGSPGVVGLVPASAVALSPDEGGPWLQYDFHLFSSPSALNVSLYFSLTLDTDPDTAMSYSLALDGGSANTSRLVPKPKNVGDLPDGWTTAAQDLVWRRDHIYSNITAGAHSLKYWAGKSGVWLERVVVRAGSAKTSYLGPPESKLLE